MVIIMTNSIVYGQPSSDKVLITREEQRNCIRWFSENQYKDSIISVKNDIITYKDTVISIQLSENKAITDTLNVLRLDYTKEQKKVRRNRRIAIGGVSGFIASLILLFTIK